MIKAMLPLEKKYGIPYHRELFKPRIRAAYIFVPVDLFRILAHVELFGIFHLFTLYDYIARVQHGLTAVERK